VAGCCALTGGHARWPRTAALAGALLLGGCGSFLGFGGPTSDLETVEFIVLPGINDDTALAAELVLVRSEALEKRLAELTAAKYFASKRDLANTFPRQFDVVRWELAPGQSAPTKPLPDGADDARAAFLFVNYRAEGTHRARLESYEDVLVTLDTDGFRLSELDD